MKKKRMMASILAGCFLLLLSACGSSQNSESDSTSGTVSDETFAEETEAASQTEAGSQEGTDQDQDGEDEGMKFKIGESTVKVEWEDNASVDALAELVSTEPLTVQMSMYGGFEQVGSLGTSLPRDDVQTTTSAGDIVLYSGNQIVVFYGSNSWAYTRLGKITGLSAGELKELLGNGDVTITIGK